MRSLPNVLAKKLIGFHKEAAEIDERTKGNLLELVEVEDLIAYGFIPEFVGRFPVLSALRPLTEDELVSIMTEPKNAILRQYQKLLEMEGVSLTFPEDAMREVAREALTRGSGARGIRAIIENVMLDVMYEVPSKPEIKEVVITTEMIKQTKNKHTSLNMITLESA